VRNLRRSDALHALGPLMTVAALLSAPAFLDIYIPGIFLVYSAAILLQALSGSDAQPKLSLESGDVPARIWMIIGLCLLASAFSDVVIAVAGILDASHLRPWIISIFSVGNLIVIGALGLSDHLEGKEADTSPEEPPAPDTEVWSRVQSYMAAKRPYLDPDLTLARLSRKLGIPAKTLSSTINRATQGNVSRYINDARIAAAQSALQAGETVTNAMLSCGFNTKSNFNREFLRVTGTSPTQWLSAQSAGRNNQNE
jgi:AraC-like DNA-binding protein